MRLKRYLAEVTPTKRPTSQNSDNKRSKILIEHLGKYSLAALTPEIIAKFREARLAGEDRRDAKGKPIPRANDTVRLDLALSGTSLQSRSKNGASGSHQTRYEHSAASSLDLGVIAVSLAR